jgi:predicted Zn-dependent protease
VLMIVSIIYVWMTRGKIIMRRVSRISWARIGLLVVVFFSACATSGYNRGQFNMISISEEAQIGKDLSGKINAEYRQQGMEYYDSRVSEYIENLGQYLAGHAPEKNFDYQFNVLKTPEINAFALPAGYIYVNTGLIAEAENEAELAGVLSHEIGHVVARHWAERYSAILVASIATEILIQTRGTQRDRLLTELAVQIVGTGGYLAYSRANEREADELGVLTMYEAGYHPEAMARFFEKMHEKKGDMSRVEVFLSTHPDPRDRESRVHETIESLPVKQNLVWDTARFQEVKKMVSSIEYPERKDKKDDDR